MFPRFAQDQRGEGVYSEGLRRGGYLVTVSNVSATYYDKVIDILDDEGSIDLEQRAESGARKAGTGRRP